MASRLKNLLVPHKGNDFHPHLFRRTAVVTLVLTVVVLEGAYVLDTQVAQNREGFLASVLPGALLSLTNADRSANGVAPLAEDPQLDKAAQLKANDMAANSYFAHVSPSGKTPWYWLNQVGYQYTYAGENLAINFDDSSAVEAAWMNSPTHRANIVKPQYTHVGYAVAQGMYEGRETTFVVQEFATKPTDATVTVEPKQPSAVTKAVDTIAAAVSPSKTAKPVSIAKPVTVAGPAVQTPAVEGTQTTASQQTQATSVTSGQPMILSSDVSEKVTSDSWFTLLLKQVAASPLRTVIYLLTALIVAMAVLLGVALFSHKKVRALEVLGGGLIVILFALSVLLYDAAHAPMPVLPNQAAATTAP